MKKFFLFILAFLINVNLNAQWSEQVSGVSTALGSVCSTPYSNIAWACGVNGVILRTTNTGLNWINVGTGIPGSIQFISISAVDVNVALVAGGIGSNACVYRTSNGGANWTQVLSETGFYNAIWMVNATTGFIFGDPVNYRFSLWKTSNGGVNWDSTGIYCPSVSTEAGLAGSMYVVYPRIWIGTNKTQIRYSSNWGTSWTALPTPGSVIVTAMCFDWLSGAQGLAGSSNLLQTSNYGINWSTASFPGTGTLSGITFTNLPVDNFIWPAWSIIATSGIYTSINGSTWTTEYTAPAGNYYAISQARPGRGIWAVRSNGGISFHTIIADVKQTSGVVPDKYSLSQNYPNPFNPITNIKFQIKNNSFVTLKVYDNLGKEVRTLVRQDLKPGYYETKFDAENLPSGVYFYKLTADGFTDVKKMVILK